MLRQLMPQPQSFKLSAAATTRRAWLMLSNQTIETVK
mgnify:CR=1 FL=1